MPDVALLDVHLNEPEDGFALARWLRSRSARIGILMLTAAGDTIDRVVGLESGRGRLRRQAVRTARAGGARQGAAAPHRADSAAAAR